MIKAIQKSLVTAGGRLRNLLVGTGLAKFIPGGSQLYEIFLRVFWSGETAIEVQGSKMYLNIFEPDLEIRKTFRAYYSNRIHEEVTTSLYYKLVQKGDVVIDLGANIGYFTLLAAKLVGEQGKVFAFEPEPRNYQYLLKNIELNQYNHVQANQKAVGDKEGKVKLFICPYDTGHHTIQQYQGIQSYRPDYVDTEKKCVEVDIIVLDNFLKDKTSRVNVIKMDVEGAEVMALKGMENIIRQNNDLVMIAEFFPLLIKEMGYAPQEFANKLFELGLTMLVIGQDYSMHDKLQGKDYLRINTTKQLMDLCPNTNDHLNLLLYKGPKYAQLFHQ